MVVLIVRQVAQGQHDNKRSHRKANYNGGKHKGLWQRVSVTGCSADDRLLAGRQTSTGEQKQIDAVRQKRQADHDREGASTQNQIDPGRRQSADNQCENKLHYASSLTLLMAE